MTPRTDHATLYRSVDVALEYDTPETIALTYFEPDELQYLPGETVRVTAHLANAGDIAETVTAALVLQDAQGRNVGFKGVGFTGYPGRGEPRAETGLDRPAGWGPLPGADVDLAGGSGRRRGRVSGPGHGGRGLGRVGAGAAHIRRGRDLCGHISQPGVQRHRRPGPAVAIYDQDGGLAAFLPAEMVAVAGGASATLSFLWTPERSGHYTASFMISAGGQEYGPWPSVSMSGIGPTCLWSCVPIRNRPDCRGCSPWQSELIVPLRLTAGHLLIRCKGPGGDGPCGLSSDTWAGPPGLALLEILFQPS